MVNLTIDEKQVQVKEGTTILEAALSAGIKIPTLCRWKGLNEIGACRVCIVEVKGMELLPASCVTLCEEGMEVYTTSPRVYEERKTNVELILSEHNQQCLTCQRSGNCELQNLTSSLEIFDTRFEKKYTSYPWPSDFPLQRNNEKCIKCMRCIQVCDKMADSNIWELNFSGGRTTVWTKDGKNIKDLNCTLCGQCIEHCPTAALISQDETEEFFGSNGILNDKSKIKVVSIAPAVRASWKEELDDSFKNASLKKLVGLLKKLGFDYVFDVDFGADLTIMEEASELLEHLKEKDKHKWPLFTSCCPAWVYYLKSNHKEFEPNLSTAKSPNQMQGAIIKSYFANKIRTTPDNIYNVAIMPCVAKKRENNYSAINSNEKADNGVKDVDKVLTIRELSVLIKKSNININDIEECDFDSPLGESTGGGVIFASTGGVMESALRSAYYFITGENPPELAFKDARNVKNRKEASFTINGMELKCAVVTTLKEAANLLDEIKSGKSYFDFVEVMACPSGCVSGGGQPIHSEGNSRIKERQKDIYSRDNDAVLKNSYENPSIKKLYNEFLKSPNSDAAHHYLHVDHSKY